MRNLRILFVIMILAARSSALAETTTGPAIDPAVARLGGNFVSGTAQENGTTLHYVRGLTVAVTLFAQTHCSGAVRLRLPLIR